MWPSENSIHSYYDVEGVGIERELEINCQSCIRGKYFSFMN